ncbi:hypothetical protein O6H91_Y001600 [Diphasiastrum complanatum]|nr:hypothetical protein O6H91_Y001600 [Diphasiastrum complanatum]
MLAKVEYGFLLLSCRLLCLPRLDDPLMWGFRGFPISNPKLSRWILTAEDICFTNPIYSYFFRLGKCIPITRGAGIYQPQMNEALDRMNDGEWLHTFPEGKVYQGPEPIRRLKWGVGSLIARAAVPTIVLPIAHSGFENVMPENYMFRRRPLLPLGWKKISIVVGEPIQFDVAGLKQAAKSIAVDSFCSQLPLTPSNFGTNLLNDSHDGTFKRFSKFVETFHTAERKEAVVLDKTQLKWVYRQITEQIQVVLQELSSKARTLNSLSS